MSTSTQYHHISTLLVIQSSWLRFSIIRFVLTSSHMKLLCYAGEPFFTEWSIAFECPCLMHGFKLCFAKISFVIQRWPVAYDSDFWFPISHHKIFCWNGHVVGQWPSVRKTWKILYLMELESDNVIGNWCPDTALWRCLRTLPQYWGGSASVDWSCTIRQTTQCNIRVSLCSDSSALCDSVQWNYLLASPTGAQQLPRELFLSPSYSTSLVS